jgi:hypothetical protein
VVHNVLPDKKRLPASISSLQQSSLTFVAIGEDGNFQMEGFQLLCQVLSPVVIFWRKSGSLVAAVMSSPVIPI